MSYREHPPGGALADWVACFWTSRAAEDAPPPPTTVYPDGCMDVIFDLGDGRVGPDRSFVVGTMRRPVTYTASPGVDLVGVRFRPGAARAVVDCDPAELVDARVALDALWGADAKRLEDAMVSLPTRSRLRVLRRALEARADPGRHDPLVRGAVDLAERTAGRISVATLARAVGRSERTLQRRFVEATGVGPKETCRVLRFQQAMRILRTRPDLGGARLAARCGYADQSHLIREFRALGATTPAAVG